MSGIYVRTQGSTQGLLVCVLVPAPKSAVTVFCQISPVSVGTPGPHVFPAWTRKGKTQLQSLGRGGTGEFVGGSTVRDGREN